MLNVHDLGLRLCEDGKLRLSTDRWAYKGPRVGDFVSEIFIASRHVKLINDAELLARIQRLFDAAPIEIVTVQQENKEQQENKVQQENIVQQEHKLQQENIVLQENKVHQENAILRQDSKVQQQGVLKKLDCKLRKRPAGRSKSLHISKFSRTGTQNCREMKLCGSEDTLNEVLHRMRQPRPHRLLLVRRISAETKQKPSDVLNFCLEKNTGTNEMENDITVSPSRRILNGSSRRSASTSSMFSSSSSNRRMQLHRSLKLSLQSPKLKS
mmetsp:Transcript_6106/g.8479  ORF Transcript_6106/g.8479 Transcript_6106/m.8479 type:complete len:269 (-) Transcript_6106:222-1028(-)|eukprot:CAMPEP_0184481894 /NCGR_PEP_ID=MMETSP0113_2-20130426/3477_1 /TAXON_ID=91329 /ORGANISM="Norrisiella sphaerica, Strain BC52" /LENGTH=268 /DNA_ID=CAMNT_0026861325 /DNA_START=109 /DNA_END=915 /DNA_ORIENTATION=+